ncbi:MAG: biotin-dependent carboxyltransferase family protein [Nocardioides sp.]|nr:biotin-dependent carboxyltransferase family protein [Nocardioides sp.]
MSLTIIDAGSLTTIQDLGRSGVAHLGVPHAGALDARAAALANRLVGNQPGDALLETTVTGVSFELGEPRWIAVTGAACEVRVDDAAVAHGQAVWVPSGARVVVGPASSGVRSCVAIAGGVDVHPVLGSRSTDTLAWVGPPRVVDGVVLPIGRPRRGPEPLDTPRPVATGPLRIVPGPRVDWFGDDVIRLLCVTTFEVMAASNRVGLRLHGGPLERTRDTEPPRELPSEGMVAGAVQVPPDGQPVVFLADHPVTGGYPVVAVVLEEDLPSCAQMRPGERIRFRPA